jgi:excisionase family DNA binding protein
MPVEITSRFTESRLWNSLEVSDYLGVSTRTLYRYVKSRKLTAIKLDGDLRFRTEDVERFLEKRTLRAV